MKQYEFVYRDNTREISNYFNIGDYVGEDFDGILDKYDQERVVDYIRDLKVGESYVDYTKYGEVYLTVTRME